ncbi:2TM domain-containing protein [Mycoplasmatota bacterium]|nr:2TM domain-containing protein [Mycoplasmatota bacterium]
MGEDMFPKEYTDEELEKIAIRRIKLRRNMCSKIFSYIVVNLFLIIIYFLTKDPDDKGMPWFVWPLSIWGVALILNISKSIQELRFTYNTKVLNKEVEKIKRSLKN